MNTLISFLAVIGSFGTAYTFLSNFILNRPNIDLELLKCSSRTDGLIVYLAIHNKSRTPISITDVTVWNHGARYSCSPVPVIVEWITRQIGNNEIYREPIKTISLPINLSSLSGTSGYFYFVFPLRNFETSSTSLTFEVSTNRFHKFQKTLVLHQK